MSNSKESIDSKIGLATALMLAVAIVATAWCAYQSHLWHTSTTFILRDVNFDLNNYVLKSLEQKQRTTTEVITFTQYLNALIKKDQNISNYYYEGFQPDLKVAVDAWLKTDPLNNPNAPREPFIMSEYNKTYELEAKQFAKDSELKLEEARQAAKNSEDYILLTVIYSSVLFIGAIIEKMFYAQGRLVLFISSVGIASIATTMLVFMPIAWQ